MVTITIPQAPLSAPLTEVAFMETKRMQLEHAVRGMTLYELVSIHSVLVSELVRRGNAQIHFTE